MCPRGWRGSCGKPGRGERSAGDVNLENGPGVIRPTLQCNAPEETVSIADQCRVWKATEVPSSLTGELHQRGEYARGSLYLEDRSVLLATITTCTPEETQTVTDQTARR